MTEAVIDHMLLMEDDMYVDDEVLNAEWTDIDVETVFDSGSSDHVMDVEECAPGHQIVEFPGSRRGGGFIVGSGEKCPMRASRLLSLSPASAQDRRSSLSRHSRQPVSHGR